MSTTTEAGDSRVAASVNLELVVDHPPGSPLVASYLAGEDEGTRFLGPHFGSFVPYEEKAREVDGRFDRAARERAVAALRIPPGADRERLERFVAEGGYMVTTGQQPGFLGGPLYNVCKALTAVRLAEALEARLGKPVLPVFWVASEDHDWAEACHAEIIGVDNELHEVSVPPADPEIAPPLHRIPLGPLARDAVATFVAQLPDTDFSAEYVALLERAFAPGRTIGDGFHDTLQSLLGRFGLFFTDGAQPTVKEATLPLLLEELDRAEALEKTLRDTAEALEAAGHALQVPILEEGVNLFVEGPKGRERLYRDGDGFRLRGSGLTLDAAGVRARVAEDPRVLSPNVLLRPVAESAVFPTLSYVAGPGEMAYLAQTGPYFEAHGIARPVVAPRWAVTPIEGKIRKVLDKFGLSVDALARPFHEVAGDVARDEMPEDVRAALGKLKGAIGSGVGELKRVAASVDKTLTGPVQQLGSTAFAALEDVEKKIVQAVKRESEIGLAQLEKAQLHLYPMGKPAERVQSPFYYLARYGGAFLDALHDRFEVKLEG